MTPVTTTSAARRPAGTLIKASPLAAGHRPEHAAAAYRIFYQGLGYDGTPRLVTGCAFVPAGSPPGDGWPVVGYAHGSTGLADKAAPSRAGFAASERSYLDGWLAAGYVVAATDYEGLATPGPHPYFNGEAVADDVIDAVRATRQLDPAIGARWLVAGFSQGGHAALFTALLATDYAPELDFVGAIAMAPPISVTALVEAVTTHDDQPVSAIVPLTLAGIAVSHAEFDPTDLLPDAGGRLIVDAKHDTLLDLIRKTVLLTNRDVGFTRVSRNELVRRVLDQSEVPVGTLDRPLFLAAGGADEMVPPEFLADFAARLRAEGTEMSYVDYPEVNHFGVLAAALHDGITWADERFHRAPATRPPKAQPAPDNRFALLDATGDGYLRRDDYELFALRMVQRLGQAPRSPKAAAVRDGYRKLWHAVATRADTDADGTVSQAEYLAWLAEEAMSETGFAADIAPLAQAVIDLVDDDRDGVLDRTEFIRLLTACRIPDDEAADVFDQLDTDKGGTITAAEIITAVRDFTSGGPAPGYWLFGRF